MSLNIKSNVCILKLKYTKLKIDYASCVITGKPGSKFLLNVNALLDKIMPALRWRLFIKYFFYFFKINISEDYFIKIKIQINEESTYTLLVFWLYNR